MKEDKYIHYVALTEQETKFDRKQLEEYEQSLKYYRDIKNVVDTSFEEGRKEERILLAKEFIKNGVSIEIVMKSTGLTKEEIENL